MRIASKLNIALFLAFAFGTIAILGVMQATIQPKFDEIERNAAKMNHERVVEAIDAATDKLRTLAQDYSYWDETHAFMYGENTDDFIASNLTPEFKAVENLHVNALVFQDLSGLVVWGAAYDLETEAKIDGLVKELADFNYSHPVLDVAPSHRAQGGLVKTSQGLVLVAISPVLKSDRSGSVAGKVIAAKRLSIAAIRELTHVEFELGPLDPEFVLLAGEIDLASSPQTVTTKSVVRDLAGQPLATLVTRTPRDVSHAGAAAVRSALGLMMVVGLISISVLWLFLNFGVIQRIEELRSHIVVAGSSGRIRLAKCGSDADEIGDLARAFNGMADQVNHLRDALADSAYMTGLSEWAAGTLHNVRNGMVPVGSMTWQIEQLFDQGWLKNLETARREYADPNTPAERRKKLEVFLAGSAQRIVDAGQQTRKLTTEIQLAGQSVLEMVAEFERFAHRKTEMTAVELEPLIEEAARSTFGPSTSVVQLKLPKGETKVLGNDVILKQVIANIFVNAIEAMENVQPDRWIEVSVFQNAANGMINIRISDNGEGIAADRLKSIFQRGVSSRKGRSGGLGLHWCANAVQLMGGTIHAESDGSGKGTTMIVRLPAAETNLEEAA